ncbi:MAG: hypothetical protein AAF236_07275 [Verrucomicrobiota bacterium]
MKNTILGLLVAILVVAIVNTLVGLDLINVGGGGSGEEYEYLVLNAPQMDQVGFASIAREDGMEPDENGQVRLKAEDLAEDPRAFRVNLLPRTIAEVENEGWTFVGTASNDHYIFRKEK